MRQVHGFHTSAHGYPPTKAAPASLCDIFVKLGGSILDDDAATANLVPHIVALSKTHRIMILTGGGKLVKRIKARHREHRSDFHSCWLSAVLSLDVNAGLLAAYSASLSVVSSSAEMDACFTAGNVAVFAPTGAILSSFHLRPDWQPTTDSMGLYFASLMGARRYVVISDVHGVYPTKPEVETDRQPLARLSIEHLESLPSSKLDPSFPAYFRRYGLPTIIVNGRYPGRVNAAICGDPTIGTEIVQRQSGVGSTDELA